MKWMASLPHYPKTPGLKAMLVSAMLFTVGTTAALVYVPWALVSKRNIDTIVGQVNQEIAVGTSQEVEKLFSSAQSAQQLLRSSLSQDLISLSNPRDRELFLLRLLQANPDFTWVQYGDTQGDFYGAQRTPNQQLNFHLRDWDPKTKTTQTTIHSYQVQGADLVPSKSETFQMNPPFYSPDRPWYRTAVAKPNQPTWTVYVYRSTRTPGMDATITLERQGKTAGVIGVGIELKQLSEYLQRLKGSHAGEAFIINAKRELIASTDVQAAMPTQAASETEPHLKHFNETTNPLLQRAGQTLDEHPFAPNAANPWHRFIYVDPQSGQRYYITLTSLNHLDWMVGTVIPEANYLGDVNRNKRILIIVIITLTVLTAGGAVLLADRLVARPILGIALTAANIEAQQFNLERLEPIGQRSDEIGQLARVFQRMAEEVHTREQQLKQQVQELRIEVNEARRSRHVQEIVETDFFQNLAAKAQLLRKRDKARQAPEEVYNAGELYNNGKDG